MTRSPRSTVGALLLLSLAGCSDDTAATPGGGIAINEIQPYGLEWVELVNTSEAAIDLDGFGLCDEDANGACDLAKSVHFPSVKLDPGGYLVIITDQIDSGQTVSVGCPPPVASCMTAQWKVSGVDGETLRLLDASGEEIASFTYPAAATADETKSWARSPDGTGEGKVSDPTPGAENP